MDAEKTEEVELLAKRYEFETDEELNRKRGVYRTHMVRHPDEQARIAKSARDLEFNEACIEAISKIIRRRERDRLRRERLKEVVMWAGLLGPFVAGLFASPAVGHIIQFAAKAFASP